MNDAVLGSFLYENLETVSSFNEETALCLCPPTHRLYIVKSAPLSQKPVYEALSRLEEPHLSKIVHIAEKEQKIEVVREYIQGNVLADLMKNGKTLPTDKAVSVTADVCSGLAALHKAGYVHRDINPNNIVVTDEGKAMIIDFGIARCFQCEKSADTHILGTPGYAAPEQFGFTQSDERTDLYAVGVLLNVMLTGKLPAEKPAEGKLGEIVKKCVEIDSAKRYRDVEELKSAVINRLPNGSLADRIISQIPGIRSKKPKVVFFACVGYFLMMWTIVFCYAYSSPKEAVILTFGWIFLFLIPLFCFHDICGIWEKFPLTRNASPGSRKIIFVFFGLFSIILGFLCVALWTQP